ncbi:MULTISPECIES: hypothetical protein [unclassified Colwellia]|uniref:hypothetical protein n=1 Tax=unclassified Colwellia TaxID=196834 RepID=UPI0015F5736D|nr:MULTISPECIES: hypothetical protein [unclassified Colwellia]MBA6231426.1 hypothetical protein [Colwellia sp. MB02u-7]MBA6235611.1 hypothetical protein [Colwellia sp. MB02u-11]MBA6254449.1 hypothetical protein [Colwellia sp. MB3u-28]MBA6259187.1 hypothetical protein [Colwellia sp. MB3u-41]MBA6298951.1 hypothetical protein [Colwellia sp. MB3u-22]
MSKYLSVLIIFLTFKVYATSNLIEVTIDNLSCLGFEITSLNDNHLIVTFPSALKNYELTNTLVRYTFLGEDILVVQNRFDSTAEKHEVEISFLQGINNGADASLIGYYASNTKQGSKAYKFPSLAKLVNVKAESCKKL